MIKENSKRIAKNTMLLYFRMLLIVIVSLYTVRVVLNTLGVVDYGIYNVVGAVVVMFSFLSNTMASASQRFFAIDIGRNDIFQLKRTFNMAILIYSIITLVILILAETLGLWFLNTRMIIPLERIEAANWIYQFSILSFLVTIMTIPFNAIIIARENMGVYAYVSFVEVILKLVVVYLLVLFSFDKLKLYSILIFGTTCIVSFIYFLVCKRKYEETKIKFYWDKELFKTLISYSGWNLFGAVAAVINNQGINILLNVFFGPVVNSARGIAFQVSSSATQFVMSFTTAVNPQIIKYYSRDEKEQMINLVFKSSKYSYYLLLILSIPILIETDFILELWLNKIPKYVIIFTQLVIINAMIDSLSFPLQTAALATGKIKYYQMIVGGILLLNLPFSFIFLKYGYPPQVTIYVSIAISITCLFSRLLMLNKMISMSFKGYLKDVIKDVIIITIGSFILPYFLSLILNKSYLINFILIVVLSIISSVLSIYFFSLSINEKCYIKKLIFKLKNQIIKKISSNE